MTPKLSRRMEHISLSAIRQILTAMKDPDLISLGGGAPSPELFPLEDWRTLLSQVHQNHGAKLYSYGLTEGYLPLRQQAAESYNTEQNQDIQPNQVVITSGAQSAIELASKILLDPGDPILIDNPTFLGTINTFKLMQAHMLPLPITDQLDISQLTSLITKHRPKLIYLIPTFQNPTGTTISSQDRRKIADTLQATDTLLIEDDPYYHLRYQGKPLPTIHSLAPQHVIYIRSYSKTIAPGIRLAYAILPEPYITPYVAAKQATDVHTNNLAQIMTYEFTRHPSYGSYLGKSLDTYTRRLEILLSSLINQFPKEFTWSQPQGGMFVWVAGPTRFNASALYPLAIQKKVAFVPGEPFYIPKHSQFNTFRLNFTNVTASQIQKAIPILSQVIQNFLSH